MRLSLLSTGLVGLLLLSGCAGMTLQRGDCEFMLPTERERCLRANESNRQIAEDRVKAKRAAEKPSDIPSADEKTQ
jgi:hypothetical protein